MKYAPHIVNELVAPEIANFNFAEIPDNENSFPNAKHWMASNFFVGSKYSTTRDGGRQIVLAYLRRSYNSLLYYHEARNKTLEYLKTNEPQNPNINAYYGAVTSWENFVLQINMAIDAYVWLNEDNKLFEPRDGSKEQRIYSIANEIKHITDGVRRKNCVDPILLPLWLTNDCLKNYLYSVSYSEASDVLIDCCNLAEKLVR